MLAKVQEGVEVIVEQDHRPVAVIKTPPGPRRKISECIALAKAYEEKLGYAPVPDPDFARDVQAAIDAHREPLNPPAWISPRLRSADRRRARRQAVSELLATLEHEHGETEIVLSSITVIELEHGLHRAQTVCERLNSAVGVAAITNLMDGDGVFRLFEDDAQPEQPFELAAERLHLAGAGGGVAVNGCQNV
ncbi:MAG TPA: hypothetical protein VNY05_33165 [Candidatus Acidoferrales bacterium]|nr:hypothetical protein [Candidatus Acidoferrales bacterium]